MIVANKTSNSRQPRLQRRGSCCLTAQRRIMRIILIYIVVVSVCIGVAVGFYNALRPTVLDHPDFEVAAIRGVPKVDEEYGYSRLTVQDDYFIQLCGVPKVDGANLHLYLTNPVGNNVWLRAEILNENKEIIGSTGVLKENEHLPTIQLSENIVDASKITVRIIGYTPHTWHSCGNVNLQINIKPTTEG